MQNIVLSHRSALQYWRTIQRCEHRLEHIATYPTPKPLTAAYARSAALLAGSTPVSDTFLRDTIGTELAFLPAPYDILVADPAHRRRSQLKRCHQWQSFYGGALVRVSAHLFVCAPELCLFQLAARLSTVELVELLYELFGLYSLGPEGQVNCAPITTRRHIETFMLQNLGIRHGKHVRRALQYTAEKAASPMETAVAMLLCLPYSLGGYGLPLPLMNEPVEASVPQARIMTSSTYTLDLFWPGANLDVEYDSNEYHLSPQQAARDARRRNELDHMGITVVSITRDQLYNKDAFDDVAHQIAKRLNVRLRTRECTYNWPDRRISLRTQLLRPHRIAV